MCFKKIKGFISKTTINLFKTKNAPTPTHLEYQQSLTPFYAPQLCSFLWLTAAEVNCQK